MQAGDYRGLAQGAGADCGECSGSGHIFFHTGPTGLADGLETRWTRMRGIKKDSKRGRDGAVDVLG